MAADFAPRHAERLLLGNEAGDVCLVDCRTAVCAELPSYPDAIFDVRWGAADDVYAVAVADNHVYIHDAPSQAVRHCLGFHNSSIRTVRYRPGHPNVIATAGRDGNLAVWDLRAVDNNSARNVPVSVIEKAHGHRGGPRARQNADSTSASVTVFNFMPLEDHLLASIGQPDYAVRFWDVRYTCRRGAAAPCHEIAAPVSGRRQRAFVSICANSTGSLLYAVSSDNHIYAYLTSNCSPLPVDRLAAPTPAFRTSGSFYIRSALSPDDRFLLCGSTEGSAFVWPTDPRRSAAYKLAEHRYEVSCVAWSRPDSPTEQYLYVGGEDYVSRVWSKRDPASPVDPAYVVVPEAVLIDPVKPPPSLPSRALWLAGGQPAKTLLAADGCLALPLWPRREIRASAATDPRLGSPPSSPALSSARRPLSSLDNIDSAECTPTRKRRQSALDSFLPGRTAARGR